MKINYFNFKRWKNKYLITNETGRFLFLVEKEFRYLIKGYFNGISADTLEQLRTNYFIFDENENIFIEKVITPYRENKSYIFSGTCLHIFVLTNICNMCCIYCQAQDSQQNIKGKMTKEIARRAVDIALQSPERALTFEFQGGEPLINFEIIRFIVEYSQSHCNDKEIQYSVVTNLLLLTDEMIYFFKENHVTVSTSLDGNQTIHDLNRPRSADCGTYKTVTENIRRLINEGVPVGAIQTTTRNSLLFPREIVDSYETAGLHHLFVRPLAPLGYAKEQWEIIGYTPEAFIMFYKKILYT